MFADLDKEKKQNLKKNMLLKEKISEAPARISKICDDLIDHYNGKYQTNGYKAMLVAPSREAAVTIQRELLDE